MADEPHTSGRCLKWLPVPGLAAFLGWWGLACSPGPDIPRVQPKDSDKSVAALVRPSAPASGYVGSRACVRCHPKICDAYHSHPMSRSSGLVNEVSRLEDYTGKKSFSVPGSYHYRVERTPKGVVHYESKTDDKGAVLYQQAVPVHLAIGSGKRGRSYATDRDGLFFQSPVTWYAGRSRWDLSPGYMVGRHPRFERRITDGCLGCHVGRVNPDAEQVYRFRKPAILEMTISCERCHGPGKEHIAFHDGPAKARAAKDPIVNPVHLPPRKRDAVCNQCHLHGEERVLRYGRTEFDFRPGMELEDVWTVFVRGGRVSADGSTRAVSQVEQMHASACFRKSNRRLGCISCHDPHSSPAEKDRASFFRRKCNQCHSGPGKTECSKPLAERNIAVVQNSCIQCHMPSLKASDVPHTSQTDHRVLRNPRKKSATTDESIRVTIFDNAEQRLPRIDVDRAKAILSVMHLPQQHGRAHAEDALRILLNVLKGAPNDVASLRAAGAAAHALGLLGEARKHWTRALELEPKNELILVNLVTLENNAGNLQDGLTYLDRLIAINPWRADFFGRKAHMLGQLRQFERGIEAAKKALELNPAMINVHDWLANTYRLLGKTSESRYHETMKQRLTPPE